MFSINGGHCQWKGGICDSPQEYVCLSKLATTGAAPPAAERRLLMCRSPIASHENLRRLREYRKEAERALREDFAVVGVLEDLSTFFTFATRPRLGHGKLCVCNPKKPRAPRFQ